MAGTEKSLRGQVFDKIRSDDLHCIGVNYFTVD